MGVLNTLRINMIQHSNLSSGSLKTVPAEDYAEKIFFKRPTK
jgi:hypothetical protein